MQWAYVLSDLLLQFSVLDDDSGMSVSWVSVMGLRASRVSDIQGSERGGRPELCDLPENCIAEILRFLSPVDVCKFACVSRTFRAAASSDYVWCQKLPVCHQHMLSNLKFDAKKAVCLSMKRIFAHLCRPISLNGGTQVVWLEKNTGALCMSVSARAMAITGIDDHRYWKWISCDESRFNEVAYLQQVWWFEVDGMIAFQLPADEYSLFFRIQLGQSFKRFGRRISTFEQVHGWGLKPVRFSLSTSDGRHAVNEYFLDDDRQVKGSNPRICTRGNWVNVYVGAIKVTNDQKITEIKFSMTQIDCTHSKGGLCLDSVSLIPKRLLKDGRKSGST